MSTNNEPASESWLQPHQLRVIDELMDLEGRLAKLKSFLASDVSKSVDRVERAFLEEQARAMANYARILNERICHWGAPDDVMVVYLQAASATDANPVGNGFELVAIRLQSFSHLAVAADRKEQIRVMTRRQLRGSGIDVLVLAR